MGSGRTELARTLFGIDRADGGEILVRGKAVELRSPQDAVAAGIALIPEDRRAQGLVLDHAIKDNVLLPLLRHLRAGPFVDDSEGDRLALELMRRLDVTAGSLYRPVRLLSGGNQQKVVIDRVLVLRAGRVECVLERHAIESEEVLHRIVQGV